MGNQSCCSVSSTQRTSFLIQCEPSPGIRSPEPITFSRKSSNQESGMTSMETSFPTQKTQRLAKPLQSKNSDVEDLDSSVSTMYPLRNGNPQTPRNDNFDHTESLFLRRNNQAVPSGSTLQFQGIEGNFLQQWSDTQQLEFQERGRRLNEEIHEIFRKLSVEQPIVEHEAKYATENLKMISGYGNSLFTSSLQKKQLDDDGWSYAGGRERMTQTGLTHTRDQITRMETTDYYDARNQVHGPNSSEGSSTSFCEFENYD